MYKIVIFDTEKNIVLLEKECSYILGSISLNGCAEKVHISSLNIDDIYNSHCVLIEHLGAHAVLGAKVMHDTCLLEKELKETIENNKRIEELKK